MPYLFLYSAAKAAFWQLPANSLKRLAKQQYKLQLTGSEVDMLIQLISHVLQGMSDNELAEILGQRHSCNKCVRFEFCMSNVWFVLML